jgi:PAS domain S-box-containing protein
MVESATLLLVHAPHARADTFARRLHAAGHTVLGPVPDGAAALAACAAKRPDVALIHQSITGAVSAPHLARQLLRLGPVPTVFLVDDETPEALSALTAAAPLALLHHDASDALLAATLQLVIGQAGSLAQARDPDDRFFAVALDMLCFLDFSGYFRRLSPAWERTLGWTLAELMSRPFLEFVHPDDRERTLAQNREVRAGGRALGFENRYLCKDGGYRWFRWNAAADLPDGVIYSVARDITEQKQASEERDRLILDLQRALAEVKTLREIIPICSYCKKVRDDSDYWQHVEAYIADHTGAKFSHGVCPTFFDHVLAAELPDESR